MSPEKQRIAILKACGWTNFYKATHKGAIQYGQPPNAYSNSWQAPDCLHDLNACHEMEKVLTGDQQHDYECHLLRMDYPDWEIKVTHATAAQRCEAFLRTLGLWEDAQ